MQQLYHCTMPAEASSTQKGKGKCESGRLVSAPPKEQLDHLSGLASTLGLPDITMSDKDVEDLDQIDQLTVAQAQIEHLIDLEKETVEREKWNHDVVEELIALSLAREEIPFDKRADLFDLRPTAEDSPPSSPNGMAQTKSQARKGKEHMVDERQPKWSTYQLLPMEAKEAWLGGRGAYISLSF